MPTHTLLGIAGNTSRPSRTRSLVQALVDATSQRCTTETWVVDIRDISPALGTTLDAGQPPQVLRHLLDAIEQTDALIVGSPVYKGTYTGLFKHLFDLVDPKVLRGKPIIISATGGSDRHALAVEHGLRPLFAFFGADIVSTALYATEGDFIEGVIRSPLLQERIERAADELARRLDGAGQLKPAAPAPKQDRPVETSPVRPG